MVTLYKMKLEHYEALTQTSDMTHVPDTSIWENELFEVTTRSVGVRYWHVNVTHLWSVVSVLQSLNLPSEAG